MHVSDPANTPFAQRRWVRRALIVTAFNIAIAIGTYATTLGGGLFWHHALYSIAVGTSIWALIEWGLRWVDKPNQPIAGPVVAAVTLASVVLGSLLGTALVDLLLGRAPLALWHYDVSAASTILVLSLLAGCLGTVYFVSQTRLAQLREQAEAAQRQATQAQLSLLQSQLEPHMLFNTLANLKALIATDPKRADAMLDRLIAYLRATLSASRASGAAERQHTLGDEFQRLSDYLALMQVRMGPRLRTTLQLPPELAATPVPPMLLQPLVENAIQHGLEPKVEGGEVQVTARQTGTELTLEVRDNGTGVLSTSQDGYGTQHVRERLATLFGNTARFERRAGSDGGTLVVLSLPFAAATQ